MPRIPPETAAALFPGAHPPAALARFDILRRLGAGGAGEVFLARSRGGRLVAIKTIADAGEGEDERETADALAREASVCVRLSHPCIVQVLAFLEEPGFAALVFEYVPGVALARILRLCASGGVRLPDPPAWHIAERVLTALAYAHGFRNSGQPTPIVHRDVSPSNILLDWDGGVKVADFGLAKMMGVSPGTRVGIIKGTPGCMSPEQARGDAVDERTDVYAAALLAWRLATGRVPFGRHRNDDHELLRAMRNPRFPPLASLRPNLPEPLLEAVAQALEPERERRTITAATLAQVVREHVEVSAGRAELQALLGRWRAALERAVRRAHPFSGESRDPRDKGADRESSDRRSADTMRYEEVALAFDEEPPEDAPTFEAHALPSDRAMLAAMPLAEQEPPATPARALAATSASEPPPEAAPGARVPPAATTAPLAAAVAWSHATRPSSRRPTRAIWLAAILTAIVAAAVIAALVGR